MSCISFLNTCPASGDTEQQLLSKILQVINTTGGGIAGVSSLSINGGAPQTGAVSITTGGTVTSVNGDPGPAVSLDSGEIPEGANLYFTEPRTLATDLAGFAAALGAITAADTILSAFGKTQGRLAALEAGTAGPFLLKAGDTGTGAFLFTPSANDVVPLTLTSTAGSVSTSNLFVTNYGATNVITLRNDGRFTLAGRIVATTTSVLGHAFNLSDAGTNNAPLVAAIAHTSTAGLGTAAAGFGAMLDFNLDSTTTLATRAVRETAAWTVATHATRTASLTFFAFTGGSETTQLTLTNNQVQGGDGTAALPAFTTRNDPNTGAYFSAADTFAFTTGGTIAATIDSSQRVGIGTASPGERLQVAGAVKVTSSVTTDVANAGAFDHIGGITRFFTWGPNNATAGEFQLFQKSSAGAIARSNFYISSGGSVSIGTSTTPGSNLDVNNLGGSCVVRVYHTTDGAAAPANFSRIALSHTAAGAGNQKANFAAETGGTGADNIDVRLIPAGTGGVFLDAGAPLVFASGTNTRAGNVTLVGGTVTVANTTVSATTIVMLTRKTSGGTIGTAITYTLSAGVSFTITSDSVLDTSTFSYLLIGNHAS